MAQTSLTRVGCFSCRYDILKSFCTIAGVSMAPLVQRRATNLLPPQRRFLSRSPRIHQEHLEGISQALKASQTENNKFPTEETDSSSTPLQASTEPSVPWYLQVAQTPSPDSLPERQKLPPLPENSPPILSDFMTYLFDTAGLDDISILDLRHLDPPAALGANLLMVIGTARSVKHLNVSADRFCRWLRSEYKLRPHADGLLGRNELKIKLRRRAKRAKLASSVGKQIDDTNRDDGITTGWVCVNVGAIPNTNDGQAANEVIIEEEANGFVGFGTEETGTRIVVQMFTEEKRAEIDIEGLWTHRVTRRAEKAARQVDQAEVENNTRLGNSL